ncbi:MAG: outer membrane protein assembly factor BamA [Puniceicoccales bacterium]|jgi:outer membrane protein insertion porin family|nr:outer membrane protein assembly factor BamA [Puniceicoccales bacterium]
MSLLCNLLKICCLGLAFILPELPAAELVVGKVEVRMEGTGEVNEAAALSRIKIREGEIFRQELNDESIRALYCTGFFDLVEVFTENGTANGRIDIVYVLHLKSRVERVSFDGNKQLSNRKLRNAISLKCGALLDRAQVQRDVEAILELYRGRGHADVAVRVRYPEESETGTDLVYVIEEGPRTPIKSITFTGNEKVRSGELRKRMSLRRRTPMSFLSGSGVYRHKQLVADLEILRDYYRSLGFLDVRIPIEDVSVECPDEKSLAININIVEGEQFHVGEIQFSGNNLYETKKLEDFLRIHRGDCFSPAKVDQSADAIRYLYGQGGRIETSVLAQRKVDLETHTIDLVFVIRESSVNRVGLIGIQGNTKTKDAVILRELSLYPGDELDLIKLRNSENRLRETRYFEQVSIIPEASDDEGIRDVLVSVSEGKTGKLFFGGAASSLENIIGFIEFSQSNCDFFNRRAHFQGAGQKFRSRFEIGTRTSQALLSFEEPWLYQRELAFGTDIFFSRSEYKKSDHNYDGATYNEKHAGLEMHLRKRIVELLEGRLYYRLDHTLLYDVDRSAPWPLQIQARAGAQWISKVGFSLYRDSRDSLLYPTIGNRATFAADYAGLGGNIHYLNWDIQTGQWFRIRGKHTHVQTFALIGKVGTMKRFGKEPIPYFDRKFLGGVTDMRGFEMHAVGPRCYREGGAPLGAQTYAYLCGEYCFKVTNPFRVAFFGEFARTGLRFMELSKPLYADAGLELRIFVMGSPLRLVFGYPIKGDKFNERRLQFNFTFGSAF